MSREDTIRAWKDEDFRAGLSDAQRSQLLEHPAGPLELSNDDLDLVAGGKTIGGSCEIWTFGCCPQEF